MIEDINKKYKKYLKKGKFYYENCENEKAIYYFSKAIESNSKEAEPYLFRGKCFMGIDDDIAVQEFTRAIEVNPNFDEAYCIRAIVKGVFLVKNSDQKLIDEVLSDYNKAIELNPNNPEYYEARGDAYKDLEEYQKAKMDYNKAIEIFLKISNEISKYRLDSLNDSLNKILKFL